MDQDSGRRLAQLFLTGGGVLKTFRQELAFEVEKKNSHERGRRESLEALD